MEDVKYVVKYTQGNGYRCGCCRSEYDEEEEFDSVEEAIQFCAQIEFREKNPRSGTDDDDIWINEIFVRSPDQIEWKNTDLYSQEYERLTDVAKEDAEKAVKEREKEKKRKAAAKKRKEKAQYEKLKVKYGE